MRSGLSSSRVNSVAPGTSQQVPPPSLVVSNFSDSPLVSGVCRPSSPGDRLPETRCSRPNFVGGSRRTPPPDFGWPCSRETGVPQNLPSGDERTAPWFRLIRAIWASDTLRRLRPVTADPEPPVNSSGSGPRSRHTLTGTSRKTRLYEQRHPPSRPAAYRSSLFHVVTCIRTDSQTSIRIVRIIHAWRRVIALLRF